jgi:hypothetical protein
MGNGYMGANVLSIEMAGANCFELPQNTNFFALKNNAGCNLTMCVQVLKIYYNCKG